MKSALAAAVIAIVASAPHALAKELSAAELRKLFPGSFSLVIFDSFTLRVNMRSNGVILGTAKGKSDTGRWSIEGSKLCVAWKTWTSGRKGCSTLRRDKGLVKGRGFYFKA